MNSENKIPVYVRVSNVSTIADMSRTQVYRLVNSGKLNIHKVGGCSFIKTADLINLIENGGQNAQC